MSKKYEHVMSVNIVVKTDSEERPTTAQIKEALDKALAEDPELAHVEWAGTEESK